jgi:hypothetical protein
MAAVTISKGDQSFQVTIPHALMTGPLSAYNEIWFTAKYDYSDLDAAAPIPQKLKSTAGVTITTAGSTTVDGVITVVLTTADTSSLPDYPYTLLYSVKGKDAANVECTLVSDLLWVKASAVKAS